MSFAGHAYSYAENVRGQLCAGESIRLPGGGGYSAFYSISCPAADSTTPAGFYRTLITDAAPAYYLPPIPPAIAAMDLPVNSAITTGRFVQIQPSDVDATWTHFRAFVGPGYDETDGNLICMCTTGDSVTNTMYVLKVDSHSGAIIWATPITGTAETDDLGLQQSVIKNGLCVIINGGSASFNIINTSSGALVSANTNASLSAYGPNTSCDIDSSVCSFGSWTGSTMTGVNGTTAFTARAFKIQPITGFPGQTTDSIKGSIPAVIGFTYTSQAQLLRPQAPDATGARQGPGFGKTRRLHRYALQMASSQGLSVGTDFAKLYPAPLRDFEGAPTYAPNVLFTGTVSEVLEDSYSYDGMLCWEITRPYPCNITAAGGMIETEDR